MTATATPCPPPEVLEALALGHPADETVRRHLKDCRDCRGRLEAIREENAFLHGFAVDGSLPGAGGEEDQLKNFAIPGYDIVREIHRGGQGVVYQARQQSTRRDIAIKVMRQGAFATLADRARFDREVETLGRLDHPNIVAVHDAGAARGFHYVIMDYIDGQDLDEWADAWRKDQGRPRRLTELVQLFIQVCDAVHAAHLRGVIHRDLKPSNIRVDRANRPHVLDFGLAKTTDEGNAPTMTRTGQFVGSLPWASPEQVEGTAEMDLRTDVYSLGVILFQLLTGELPFNIDSNLRQTLDNIMTREPPPPSLLAPDRAENDELDTIVLKCLAKDRARRYQSAGELAQDLRRHLAGDPIEAKRDSAMYILRKTLGRYRLRVAAAGALLLLTGIFALIMTMLYQRSAQLERDAVRAAGSFSELLSQSRIEQGRLAGLLGNSEQAETLLWRELLTQRAPGQPAPRLTRPPGRLEAYWALWNLYRNCLCLRTLPLDAAPRTACHTTRDNQLRTVDATGQITHFDQHGQATPGPKLQGALAGGLPALHPGGEWALSITTTHYVLWNLPDPTPVLTLPHSEGDRGNAALSPDASLLVISDAGQAALYRTSDLAEHARFGDSLRIDAVAISHDAGRLATRDVRGNLTIWNIATGHAVHRFPGGSAERSTPRATDLLFSQDDQLLVDAWIGSPGRIVNLTHLPPRTIELQESPGAYRTVAFHPDGQHLAIGDLDGSVRIFDTTDGARQRAFVAHPRIRSLGFERDAERLWTCGDDSIRVWELRPEQHQRIERIPGEQFLHTVDVARDGTWLAAGGGSGQLRIRPADQPAWLAVPLDNPATIASVAINADGTALAAATYANTVCIWQATGPARLPDASHPLVLDHPHRVSHVCFSDDGTRIATACDDGTVRIWNAADGRLEDTLSCGSDRLPQVAINATGQRIAVARRDGGLLLWTPGSEVAPLSLRNAGLQPVRTVRFADGGETLYSAGADRTIRIWNVADGTPVDALAGHSHEIYCLDVAPDGDLLASGDAGGAVQIWDARSRRPLLTLTGHTGAVMAIRFTPEGGLVTASLDGTLRWWDLGFYRRHVAGQVHAQLRRLDIDPTQTARADEWRAWADQILHNPNQPAPGPPTPQSAFRHPQSERTP